MKKFFIDFIGLLSFCLFTLSCSNESSYESDAVSAKSEMFNDQESAALNKLLSPEKIEIEDALSIVKGLFAYCAETRTTSTEEQDCLVITTHDLPFLPTEYLDVLPDTLIYILHQNGHKGFAVISADNRTEDPILAINEDDYADSLDFVNNSKHALWVANIIEGEYNSIVKFEITRDSIQNALYNQLLNLIPDGETTRAKQPEGEEFSIEDYYFEETDHAVDNWSIASEKSPLLSTTWGQGSPYNNCVKDKISENSAYTGCTTTATAQLVAYWEYPTIIHGTTFDWNQITEYQLPISSYSIERTGLLMKFIGEDIDTNYQLEGSSASPEKAYNWLISQGYTGNSSMDYSTSTVIASIVSNKPVLISGYTTEVDQSFLGITYNTYYKDGHTWIVDGYRSLKRLRHHIIIARNRVTGHEKVILDDYYYQHCKLLHNNWGWDGYCNGWFAEGNFDAYAPSTINITRGSGVNFRYNLKIYPNIAPGN